METTAKKTAKVTQFVWPKGWRLFKTVAVHQSAWERRKRTSFGHGVLLVLKMTDGTLAERRFQRMTEVPDLMEEVKPLIDVDPGTKYDFIPATLDCLGCMGRSLLARVTVAQAQRMAREARARSVRPGSGMPVPEVRGVRRPGLLHHASAVRHVRP